VLGLKHIKNAWQMDLDCLENTTKDCGTNMTTMNVTVVDDFNLDDWLKQTHKLELLEFKHDPVALAIASYRIWRDTGIRWTDLENTTPLEEDVHRAQQLRKYYAGQMTFDALKGSGLKTEFRRKLYAIATNCHTYTKEDIGLLHRLPYFYEEDLTLDSLVNDFKSVEVS
jgi:hypothetical protein